MANNLQKLEKILGAPDWSKLNDKQMAKLAAMAGKNQIKREEIAAIIALAPSFVKLSDTYFQTIVNTTEAIKANQKASLDILYQYQKSLHILCEGVKTDSARVALGAIILDGMKEVAKVNKQNNKAWIALVSAAGSSLALVLFAFRAAS